jgi:KipI family sensor histidine kinase inhibitor
MSDDWRLEWLGDAALSIHAVEVAPLDANTAIHRLARRLRLAGVTGVRDIVPGMSELVVHVDPLRCDVRRVAQALRRAGPDPDVTDLLPPVQVPVVYGGDSGPDLEDVARACGLVPDDVCDRHAAVEYVVCFLGFLPGFAYLGPLDPRLRLPRRATPRSRVPPGSVAIAGEYSGIYPWASPGGWHIIGRTDLSMFDLGATPPARLAPGARVQFVRRGGGAP